jgi:hypothetical protein
MRLIRFANGVRWLARKHLLSWRNVKATWFQSQRDWQARLPSLELTEQEWREWQAAIGASDAPDD